TVHPQIREAQAVDTQSPLSPTAISTSAVALETTRLEQVVESIPSQPRVLPDTSAVASDPQPIEAAVTRTEPLAPSTLPQALGVESVQEQAPEASATGFLGPQDGAVESANHPVTDPPVRQALPAQTSGSEPNDVPVLRPIRRDFRWVADILLKRIQQF